MLLKAAKERQELSIDASRVADNYKTQETFHTAEVPNLNITAGDWESFDTEEITYKIPDSPNSSRQSCIASGRDSVTGNQDHCNFKETLNSYMYTYAQNIPQMDTQKMLNKAKAASKSKTPNSLDCGCTSLNKLKNCRHGEKSIHRHGNDFVSLLGRGSWMTYDHCDVQSLKGIQSEKEAEPVHGININSWMESVPNSVALGPVSVKEIRNPVECHLHDDLNMLNENCNNNNNNNNKNGHRNKSSKSRKTGGSKQGPSPYEDTTKSKSKKATEKSKKKAFSNEAKKTKVPSDKNLEQISEKKSSQNGTHIATKGPSHLTGKQDSSKSEPCTKTLWKKKTKNSTSNVKEQESSSRKTMSSPLPSTSSYYPVTGTQEDSKPISRLGRHSDAPVWARTATPDLSHRAGSRIQSLDNVVQADSYRHQLQCYLTHNVWDSRSNLSRPGTRQERGMSPHLAALEDRPTPLLPVCASGPENRMKTPSAQAVLDDYMILETTSNTGGVQQSTSLASNSLANGTNDSQSLEEVDGSLNPQETEEVEHVENAVHFLHEQEDETESNEQAPGENKVPPLNLPVSPEAVMDAEVENLPVPNEVQNQREAIFDRIIATPVPVAVELPPLEQEHEAEAQLEEEAHAGQHWRDVQQMIFMGTPIDDENIAQAPYEPAFLFGPEGDAGQTCMYMPNEELQTLQQQQLRYPVDNPRREVLNNGNNSGSVQEDSDDNGGNNNHDESGNEPDLIENGSPDDADPCENGDSLLDTGNVENIEDDLPKDLDSAGSNDSFIANEAKQQGRLLCDTNWDGSQDPQNGAHVYLEDDDDSDDDIFEPSDAEKEEALTRYEFFQTSYRSSQLVRKDIKKALLAMAKNEDGEIVDEDSWTEYMAMVSEDEDDDDLDEIEEVVEEDSALVEPDNGPEHAVDNNPPPPNRVNQPQVVNANDIHREQNAPEQPRVNIVDLGADLMDMPVNLNGNDRHLGNGCYLMNGLLYGPVSAACLRNPYRMLRHGQDFDQMMRYIPTDTMYWSRDYNNDVNDMSREHFKDTMHVYANFQQKGKKRQTNQNGSKQDGAGTSKSQASKPCATTVPRRSLCLPPKVISEPDIPANSEKPRQRIPRSYGRISLLRPRQKLSKLLAPNNNSV